MLPIQRTAARSFSSASAGTALPQRSAMAARSMPTARSLACFDTSATGQLASPGLCQFRAFGAFARGFTDPRAAGIARPWAGTTIKRPMTMRSGEMGMIYSLHGQDRETFYEFVRSVPPVNPADAGQSEGPDFSPNLAGWTDATSKKMTRLFDRHADGSGLVLGVKTLSTTGQHRLIALTHCLSVDATTCGSWGTVVVADARNQGVGLALLRCQFEAVGDKGFHSMIGVHRDDGTKKLWRRVCDNLGLELESQRHPLADCEPLHWVTRWRADLEPLSRKRRLQG